MERVLTSLFLKLFSRYFIILSSLILVAVVSLDIIVPNLVSAQCVAGAPTNLTAKWGNNPGTVWLSWTPAKDANRYALVFGLASGKYMFGALNIDGGPMPMYMVTHLAPGVRYFFDVWAFCDNAGPATASSEVSVVAPGRAVDPK